MDSRNFGGVLMDKEQIAKYLAENMSVEVDVENGDMYQCPSVTIKISLEGKVISEDFASLPELD